MTYIWIQLRQTFSPSYSFSTQLDDAFQMIFLRPDLDVKVQKGSMIVRELAVVAASRNYGDQGGV